MKTDDVNRLIEQAIRGDKMNDLVYRLRKRAEIRRQISSRKSVQEGQPDRIADLLEEAADYIEQVRADEREACAKLCLEGTDMPVQVDAIKIIRAERERISNAIRARGVDTVNTNHKRVDETAKRERKWVGLTDEEVINCFDSVAFGQVEDDLIINKHVNIFTAIHYIEAKLKEKNT